MNMHSLPIYIQPDDFHMTFSVSFSLIYALYFSNLIMKRFSEIDLNRELNVMYVYTFKLCSN